jgi:hypothetical protein
MARAFETAAAARAFVKAAVGDVLNDLTLPGLQTETRRALKRFALVAVAGEFAASHGLIPTDPATVRAAVKRAALQWLAANGDTDDLRIVASVRAFLHRHAARFQGATEARALNDDQPIPSRAVIDRCGWVKDDRSEWWILPHGLTEAAPGNDAVTIARALKAGGYLRTDKDGRLMCRVTVERARPRVYAVLASILDEEPRAMVDL